MLSTFTQTGIFLAFALALAWMVVPVMTEATSIGLF
jgi:hypothetical protein